MPDNPIDVYLAGLAEPKRSTLEDLRGMLLDLVPGAEECLAYGVPAIKRDGKLVAGFAAFKNHLSYLPHSGSLLASLGAEVADYDTSKGALKFAVDAPLPLSLVEKLVAARLEEIDGES